MRLLPALVAVLSVVAVVTLWWVLDKPARSPVPEQKRVTTTAVPQPTAASAAAVDPDAEAAEADNMDEMEDHEFDDLVAKSEGLAAQFEHESSEAIAAAMLRAFREHKEVDFEVAKNHLVVRAKAGDKAAVGALVSALRNGDDRLQARTVPLLGEIATPDSVVALLDLARDSKFATLRPGIYSALSGVGRWRDAQQPAAPMSALLEEYFSSLEPTDATGVLSVSQALAGLGTSSGVQSVLRYIERLSTGENSQSDLRNQLIGALRATRGDEAVTTLSDYLHAGSPANDNLRIAGSTLAAMANPRATSVLLDWAATVKTPAAADQVATWLDEVRDPESLNLLLKVGERQDFQDSGLQQRLLAIGQRLAQQAQPQDVE